ncbi:DUF1178 family protein [Sphingomonas endophytica]|uniref:Putative regulatory protein FmdB zinc ribbon domain-containing protein n=1 Tax=Sphingomonas endophytica TaxID=869719 RepID=A0A147I1E7_9SPHN|nr:DUF1178 family protein [Sphingomonas endophytica]KTT71402.1 hypothetical protein NS334_10540 [Sphingomonas endophytica]
MIVFDLRCATDGHVFEAWFASSAAFDDQRERQLLACPMCGGAAVEKAVMAPNVSPKANRAPAPDRARALLAELARAQAEALAGSRWVGGDFASEARAMHVGDKPDVAIHGQASLAEAKQLLEEGVPIAPLPLPVVPPAKVN